MADTKTLREKAQGLIGSQHVSSRMSWRRQALDVLSALAAQAQAEPVAFCQLTKSGKIAYFDGKPMVMPGTVGNECHPDPLYTAPQPAAQPVRKPLADECYSVNEIVTAALYADIPDGVFQSLLIGLGEASKARGSNGITGEPAAQPVAVPDGLALVPTKATPEMLDALRTGSGRDCPSDELCRVRFAALLAAAPKGGANG